MGKKKTIRPTIEEISWALRRKYEAIQTAAWEWSALLGSLRYDWAWLFKFSSVLASLWGRMSLIVVILCIWKRAVLNICLMCALQYRSQHRALQNAIRHFVFADESDSELERAITAIDGGDSSCTTADHLGEFLMITPLQREHDSVHCCFLNVQVDSSEDKIIILIHHR